MQFNLVFESNPARDMYRKLGFEEIGRIPEAVEGEDALIYWRSLADIRAVSDPDVSVERHGDHVGVGPAPAAQQLLRHRADRGGRLGL